MSCVVHGFHILPIVGPAFHILGMAGLQILNFSQFPFFVKLLYKQIFAAVHNRLCHCVF